MKKHLIVVYSQILQSGEHGGKRLKKLKKIIPI